MKIITLNIPGVNFDRNISPGVISDLRTGFKMFEGVKSWIFPK